VNPREKAVPVGTG